MAPQPTPISDLARMYRERIPTAPKSIGRLGPVQIGGGGLSLNPMPALRQAVNWFRNQPGTNISTPINTGRGVSMGGQGGASQLVFDPAAQAVERAVGDITAIPGIGQPSPSYTAEQIRQQGVVPGVLGAAMDYSMFAPAVGAGVRAGRNAMRAATADAAERLAQSMSTREMGMTTAVLPDRPTVNVATAAPERPTIYMGNAVYDPNPPGQPFTYSDIDNLLNELNEGRPQVTTQMPGVVEGVSQTNLPRGVYAVDSPRGDITLYQISSDGTVGGRLIMRRDVDGYSVVSMSAPPGSPAAANLLAGAKITADLNFPGVQYPLSPSHNLSQYSRPLVEKLQAAGLVDPEFVLPDPRLINTINAPFDLDLPIPIQDVPRLSGIDPRQLQQTTRELIKTLAEAKRQGRISPDTLTRTAELRAQLAARQYEQALLQQRADEALAARTARREQLALGEIENQRPTPMPRGELASRANAILGPDDGARVLELLDSPPNEMVEELFQVTDINEVLLDPLETFASSPAIDGVSARMRLDDIADSMADRLVRLNPGVYSREDDRFVEAVWNTIADLWYDYGGQLGNRVMDAM